jgi:DNA-binding CsgD family transcriptional regulator
LKVFQLPFLRRESNGKLKRRKPVPQALQAHGYRPTRALRNAERVANTWLTARQREVLSMYAAGMARHQILGALNIGKKTIDNHIRSAKLRLGAATLYQAVAMYAMATNLKARGRSSKQQSSVPLQ